MELYTFTVGPFAENTYLLVEEGKALLVDPGFYEPDEFKAFQQKLETTSSELIAVVLTHAHLDHILGLKAVRDHYDVSVYLYGDDRYLWENSASQAKMFGFNLPDFDFEPKPLQASPDWKIGPFRFDVRHTPGHAPDHLSLYHQGEGIVIAGDTLFKQGIGRTDLYKGDFKLLDRSIREKLYSLPGETTVYPGHGPSTTIAYEKENNPFVTA